jgi:hypothetical protein
MSERRTGARLAGESAWLLIKKSRTRVNPILPLVRIGVTRVLSVQVCDRKH